MMRHRTRRTSLVCSASISACILAFSASNAALSGFAEEVGAWSALGAGEEGALLTTEPVLLVSLIAAGLTVDFCFEGDMGARRCEDGWDGKKSCELVYSNKSTVKCSSD